MWWHEGAKQVTQENGSKNCYDYMYIQYITRRIRFGAKAYLSTSSARFYLFWHECELSTEVKVHWTFLWVEHTLQWEQFWPNAGLIAINLLAPNAISSITCADVAMDARVNKTHCSSSFVPQTIIGRCALALCSILASTNHNNGTSHLMCYRVNDIFIVSAKNSGNTWTHEITQAYKNQKLLC